MHYFPASSSDTHWLLNKYLVISEFHRSYEESVIVQKRDIEVASTESRE